MAGAEVSFAGGKMLAQKAGGIGTMTFNNLEKRNAVSFAMWKAARHDRKAARQTPNDCLRGSR